MSSLHSSQESYLSQLELTNFRNITHSKISFSPQFNLFVGNNGQGKTNFLESIALACSLKPLQNLKNINLIQAGHEKSQIKAQFGSKIKNNLNLIIQSQGKKGLHNNNKIKTRSIYIKNYPLVSFIPQELLLITGSSQLRRRALDQITTSLYFEHIDNLRNYDKALANRNKILKDWPINNNLLEIFTNLVIQESVKIISLRLQALDNIKKFFSQEIQNILGKNSSSEIFYNSQEQNIDYFTQSDLISYMTAWHEKTKTLEPKRRVTLFGPHLDDLVFELNNLPAKSSASRGQTRALVLALKLSHLHAVTQIREYPPIVLLDDIFSELDSTKIKNLINLVHNLGLQVFFTATSSNNLETKTSQTNIYTVSSGSIL